MHDSVERFVVRTVAARVVSLLPPALGHELVYVFVPARERVFVLVFVRLDDDSGENALEQNVAEQEKAEEHDGANERGGGGQGGVLAGSELCERDQRADARLQEGTVLLRVAAEHDEDGDGEDEHEPEVERPEVQHLVAQKRLDARLRPGPKRAVQPQVLARAQQRHKHQKPQKIVGHAAQIPGAVKLVVEHKLRRVDALAAVLAHGI
mmetsp:Transcript_50360/g.93626  ORF Transcript_50360/g.93626 Transcript_50360/m.93626 type:complete len:208 (+) Transcript_50360:480-1103(+)